MYSLKTIITTLFITALMKRNGLSANDAQKDAIKAFVEYCFIRAGLEWKKRKTKCKTKKKN